MDTITLLTLHDLIAISNARSLGYEKVLLKPLAPELFKILKSSSKENQRFAEEVNNFIHGKTKYEVYPHLIVPVYNKWVKVQLEENTDSIINACVEAERVTFQAYKSALEAVLPAEMDSLVKTELKSIKKIIDTLSLHTAEVQETTKG